MKKKILLFEPDELFRNTLLEQISLNKDFAVTEVSSFDDVQSQLVKSSFDLLIMGTDTEAYRLSSIGRFIKDAKITSVVLFMIDAETSKTLSFEGSKEKLNFIEKPFRIHHFNRTISTILAKISNLNDVTHKIGPFIFFPLKKIIMLDEKIKVELTGKEVDILKCLISSAGEAVDRDKLLKQVWNYSSDVTTHTLETHIYRLRQKLEADPSIPRLIISQAGGFSIRTL
jgi:DNA-binding response OmpR family regulator